MLVSESLEVRSASVLFFIVAVIVPTFKVAETDGAYGDSY